MKTLSKPNSPLRLCFLMPLCVKLVFITGCNQRESFFKILPASRTNIHFQNTLLSKDKFNILYYIYYYNGGGVATGDINNDGLPDIYFTANNHAANKLYLNKGNFEFEDITEAAGVAGKADWCTGVTMADVNSDGFLDIYVSTVSSVHGLAGKNELYINNRNNTFTEQAAVYGLDFSGLSTQAAFFDYDHDGDLDCYLLNHSQRPHANIVDTSNRRKPDALSGDRLYRNDNNKFTDVSAAARIYQSSLGYGLGLAVADINNDGWEDIYVGNDFHENDYYYVNNHDGTFTESGAKTFDHYSRFSMGNDVADFNNDGEMDVVTVDMLPDDEKILKTYGSDENPDTYQQKLEKNGYQHQYSRNVLQRNNGDGSSFSEVGLLTGIAATDWSWSPLFADFDNDGRKDLFISSGIVKRPVDLDYIKFVSDLANRNTNAAGSLDKVALDEMPEGRSHPYLFRGTFNDSFENVSTSWGTAALNGFYNGAAYADLDNDGDLDIVINAIDDEAVVLQNNAPRKNYLSIAFKDTVGNTKGIGCKVYLSYGEKIQYQQLMATRGFQSASEQKLHFGLDSISKVGNVLVIWPDQSLQELENVSANKRLVVEKKNATDIFKQFDSPRFPRWKIMENHTKQWKHRENPFVDFNIQYLIPHAQSTRGPKLAVADVNGDGLDDFYACGAAGQPGAMLMQQKNGGFVLSDTALFNRDAGHEEVDAIFFDANGDTKPDLCVVSGGNQLSNHPLLADRLYLNDGKGKFIKSEKALPAILSNKSCVVAADADKDGDNDLFIGTLADPVAFGRPQTSHLLLNDGKGVFTNTGTNSINLVNVGMVTSAAFADLNNDQWPDLVVAGEWMPITIFINNKGSFEKKMLPQSSGLWQNVFLDDLNGDGHMDLLAGNWGWNNKFHNGKTGPLKLYVGDFDNNKQTEQLLSYTINGTEYPFLAKDEVERPLPLLKKHYLRYAQYAGVPMQEVFYGWIDTVKPYMAERLGSVSGWGDGKGNFEINDLPAQLQLAPVFCFQRINTNGLQHYLAGGNFFDVIPYEGRYDAQAISYMSIDTNRQVSVITGSELKSIKGQVRDIKRLRAANGKEVIVIARNNDTLLFMTKN